MSIVIDASVAVKWVLDEAGKQEAAALLDESLIAPSFWLVECGNVLWKRAKRGEISPEEAQERLNDLAEAPVKATPTDSLLGPALGLALELGHPVYDCLYLALALRHGTYVLTADRRFHAAAQKAISTRGAIVLLGA